MTGVVRRRAYVADMPETLTADDRAELIPLVADRVDELST